MPSNRYICSCAVGYCEVLRHRERRSGAMSATRCMARANFERHGVDEKIKAAKREQYFLVMRNRSPGAVFEAAGSRL